MKYNVPDKRHLITDEEIKHLKVLEIELLDEFVRVCNLLNLTYFLCAGTLLGAVRHQGFIPWDDDIDVQMPRKDYEVFAKEAPKHLNESYFLASLYSEKNCFDNFMKLRNSKTTFVESSSRNYDINHGVYIDIFAIDGISDDKRKQKHYTFQIEKYKSRAISSSCYSQFVGTRSLKGKLFSLLSHLLTIGQSTNKCMKKRNEYILSHQDETSKDVIVESKTHRLYPRNVFNGTCPVTFEGKTYNGPKDLNEYLTIQYGPNYMTLPPIEKRMPHHYCCLLDLNISFEDVMKAYIND